MHSQYSFSAQSLRRVRLFATPWTAARQASLSITSSQSLLKLMSVESVMPSNHLILCCPLLLPPSGFPSIRVCSNESVLLSLLVYPVHRRLVLSTPRRLHVEPLSFRFTFLSVQVFRRQIVSGFVCLKCFLFSLWGKKKKSADLLLAVLGLGFRLRLSWFRKQRPLFVEACGLRIAVTSLVARHGLLSSGFSSCSW